MSDVLKCLALSRQAQDEQKGKTTQNRTTLRVPLVGPNRSILIGNLRPFWIYFTDESEAHTNATSFEWVFRPESWTQRGCGLRSWSEGPRNAPF
jgi:hypothetical protein